MNKEDLFEGFGALDDDLLKRSEHGGKKRKKFSGFLKYGSVAACLVVMLGVGMLFMDNKTSNLDTNSESDDVEENIDNISDKQGNRQEELERYVDVSKLLVSNEGVEEQDLVIGRVEIGEYSALYYKVASVNSDILKESTGSEVEGIKNWLKLSGHEDMQYLISSDKNEYSLWKFGFFQKENYPYSDVLQIIYNIYSAEDIAKIIVAPANMDNTDEGEAIQDEIGTSIVVDEKAIETIYDVLSGLTCYGGDNWDVIGLGDDTPSAMLNQVRSGRYLTIITSQGMEIDTLKYTGISGMFYEYGGIAYNALTMEEKAAVEEILDIGLVDETSNPVTEQNKTQNEINEELKNNEPEASSTTQDIPVDEETYQEARTYSAELMDLQNRISEAMMNNELPFVISSSIYENPDRVYVRVNTTDESLIAKLRAFDTTGKLLEIEYSEHTAIFDM